MKRLKCILISLLIALCANSNARVPIVRYGLEWGMGPMLFSATDLNYITSEGYRIDQSSAKFDYFFNGFALANVGVNLSDYFSLALYTGYMGISKDNRVIPLFLRFSGHLNSIDNDGIFVFCDGGVGFHIIKDTEPMRKPALMGDCGLGYNFRLSSGFSLNYKFYLKATYDNLLIIDSDSSAFVPREMIHKASALYLAPCLAVELLF